MYQCCMQKVCYYLDQNYPFIFLSAHRPPSPTEEGMEAMDSAPDYPPVPSEVGPSSRRGTECAVVELARVTVTLETGSGALSQPLVKLQARATCTFTGFLSSKVRSFINYYYYYCYYYLFILPNYRNL
jgi:hypothetical protein